MGVIVNAIQDITQTSTHLNYHLMSSGIHSNAHINSKLRSNGVFEKLNREI